MKFKALNYTELIPIVIKVMQEMDAENKQLKQELAELRQMIMELKNDRNKGNTGTSKSSFLQQSVPNPTAGNTVIGYQVPATS